MKLTAVMNEVLATLDARSEPWNALGRSNRIILGKLEKRGLAKMMVGYPCGWIITELGRSQNSGAK